MNRSAVAEMAKRQPMVLIKKDVVWKRNTVAVQITFKQHVVRIWKVCQKVIITLIFIRYLNALNCFLKTAIAITHRTDVVQITKQQHEDMRMLAVAANTKNMAVAQTKSPLPKVKNTIKNIVLSI